ncbi:MAG TPA: hypothetical protein VGU22_15025 [Methylomirabilota bacterium]|nr:hypothetical protein [Methylomirabilota bacterium]
MSTIVDPTVRRDDAVELAWSPRTRVPSGIAAAALASAMIGMLTLAVVNVFTAASPAFNTWVHSVGKLWMPGAEGIGPYSGKETLSAVAWLGSWVMLHFAFRRRELDLSRCVVAFLVGVGVATTLIWPPVFEYLAHLIHG